MNPGTWDLFQGGSDYLVIKSKGRAKRDRRNVRYRSCPGAGGASGDRRHGRVSRRRATGASHPHRQDAGRSSWAGSPGGGDRDRRVVRRSGDTGRRTPCAWRCAPDRDRARDPGKLLRIRDGGAISPAGDRVACVASGAPDKSRANRCLRPASARPCEGPRREPNAGVGYWESDCGRTSGSRLHYVACRFCGARVCLRVRGTASSWATKVRLGRARGQGSSAQAPEGRPA